MIGLTVRELCVNMHFITHKLKNEWPNGKNIKQLRNGPWIYVTTTLESKVTQKLTE